MAFPSHRNYYGLLLAVIVVQIFVDLYSNWFVLLKSLAVVDDAKLILYVYCSPSNKLQKATKMGIAYVHADL